MIAILTDTKKIFLSFKSMTVLQSITIAKKCQKTETPIVNETEKKNMIIFQSMTLLKTIGTKK